MDTDEHGLIGVGLLRAWRSVLYSPPRRRARNPDASTICSTERASWINFPVSEFGIEGQRVEGSKSRKGRKVSGSQGRRGRRVRRVAAMKKTMVIGVWLIGSLVALGLTPAPAGRWSEAKANEWYAKQPWLVGSNYIPATAINELEMWQAETFDPRTHRQGAGLGREPGHEHDAGVSARPGLAAGRRRLSRADRPLPRRSRATSHQAAVRAVRFLLGSIPEARAAARAEAWRAQFRLAAEPRREGVAGSERSTRD